MFNEFTAEVLADYLTVEQLEALLHQVYGADAVYTEPIRGNNIKRALYLKESKERVTA